MAGNDNKRTFCKYGDCDLEKLESEFKILNKIWSNLEKNWTEPTDIEDVYRIYPLLDTTAALSRKRLIHDDIKNNKYKVKVIEPTKNKTVDTSSYLYSNEHDFFNGNKKECLLADIVSTCLHGSDYVYMDTRKKFHDNNKFEIYVLIKTDRQVKYINVQSYLKSMLELIKDSIEAKTK